jgi:transposase-like protein
MGQVLHGSAKTTHAVRGELQRSQASVASLAKRFGINEKTVIKWRKRQSGEDMPMGPKERRSTVLSPMEEVAIVALRVQARLPLDDVFIALKDVIPHLPSRNSGNQSPRSLTSSLTITRWDQTPRSIC